MNLKELLTDEFVTFSAKVADVHGRIKDLKSKFQAEMKALTDEAEGLRVEYETMKRDSSKETTDPATSPPTSVEKTTRPASATNPASRTSAA